MSSINCSFIGSTHLYEEGTPYILGKNDNEKSIIIGCNVFMGAHSKIIGNVSVGYGSIIGANTTVLKDVPPLSVVVGSEGKIVKRYNMEEYKWDKPENVNTELYLSEEEYRERLLRSFPTIPKFKYAASSKVGWL
ncbi:hypothetical protein AGMMS4952_26230 [Spirochaetia bacterium]|nr:hypothetical protein AGMMS4952_26230 [Spirochaetia bacterium]